MGPLQTPENKWTDGWNATLSSELRETVVNCAALNWITFLPVMDELDAEPTIQEFILEYPQIKAENWTHLNNGPSGNNNLMKRAIFYCGGGLIFFPSIPVFNCFACRKTFPLLPRFVCKRFSFTTPKIYCTNNKKFLVVLFSLNTKSKA